MKSYISGFVTCLILCLSVTAFAAGGLPGIKTAEYTDKIAIEINGQKQDVEVVSVVKENEEWPRNYVAVGDIAPALGATVNWIGERQTVEIKTTGNIATLPQAQENWMTFREIINKYDISIGGDMNEIKFYTSDGKTLITTITPNASDSRIGVKTDNDRIYLNVNDLLQEGIITE